MKIIYDVFPAKLVAVPAGQVEEVDLLTLSPPTDGAFYVDTARVIVTEDMILVAVDSPEGAKLVFQEKYDLFVPGNQYYVVTQSGKMLSFEKDTGCGCGSRLRSWNPTRTLYSIKDLRGN
jgi:hypothetical protein